jgi:Uma2 family endonuclease
MNIPIYLDRPPVTYPESDGKPMADNTVQFRWIVTLQGGLDAIYRNDPLVFVAGDLFWYPVEGNNTIFQAPDVMVVFGRPKGDRGSYRQWLEGGTAPQVVFEIVSPNNRPEDGARKFDFYERYGVEEYYILDPDRHTLTGWRRSGKALKEMGPLNGWVSPRLGIRFQKEETGWQVYGPDGSRFLSFVELADQVELVRREKEQAQKEKEQAQKEKEQAELRAERLAAQLKELGLEPPA